MPTTLRTGEVLQVLGAAVITAGHAVNSSTQTPAQDVEVELPFTAPVQLPDGRQFAVTIGS